MNIKNIYMNVDTFHAMDLDVLEVVKTHINKPWFENNLMHLHIGGSFLYGTDSDHSDVDVRGFYFKPLDFILGAKQGCDVFSFETEELDAQLWDVRKFVTSVGKGAPNMVESLFSHHAYHETDLGRMIIHKARGLLNDTYITSGLGFAKSEFIQWEKKNDGKNLSHAVRLLFQLHEYLTTDKLTFPSPIANKLLRFKDNLDTGEAVEMYEYLLKQIKLVQMVREPVERDIEKENDLLLRIYKASGLLDI